MRFTSRGPIQRDGFIPGCRTGSITFREPPKGMFPVGSGVGAQGPDYLTFDLADDTRRLPFGRAWRDPNAASDCPAQLDAQHSQGGHDA